MSPSSLPPFRRDLAFALLALMGAAVLTVSALWQRAPAPQPTAEALGNATEVKAGRRRAARSLDWRRLEENSTVFVGDSIFVGQGGHAVLLVDGDALELAEETLVVITKRRSKLVEGELLATTAREYTISARETTWTQTGAAVFRARPGGEHGVDVLSGRVSRDGVRWVDAPGYARLSSTGQSTDGPYAARPLAPAHNARLRPNIAFRFQAIGGERVEVVDEIGHAQTLACDEDLTLPSGTYRWSVVGDDGSQRSARLRFIVLQSDRPEIVYPIADAQVVVPETRALTVVFDPVQGSVLHEVTLWQPYGDFRQVMRTSLTRASFSPGLAEGDYVVSARAIVDGVEWPSAPARSFSVTHKAPPKVPETQDAQILPLRP